MKSLHYEVRQRRAAESEIESARVQPAGPALVVCRWKGECWVLPWAQFVGARLDSSDGGRQLDISFANYRVTVIGENLAGLLDDLAGQRITHLRELPKSYRAQPAEGAPFVGQIDVVSIGEATVPETVKHPGKICGTPDT